VTFKKPGRQYWYTYPTLPGFGRIGPWSTGATSKRLADSIEMWLRQLALTDPRAVKGIVDGAYTLREAYVAHGLGKLDDLRDAITDPKGQGRMVNSVHRSLYAGIKGVLSYHLGEARKRAITMEVQFRYEDDTREVDTTPDQMAKLLSACDAELYDLAVGAVLTGIDQGPLLKMTPDHFDWIRQTVRVHDTKNRARQRTIELSDDAAAHFRVLAHNAKGGKLFHLTEGQVGRRWRQAREDAKVGDIRFKDLRHVFANAWVDDGGNLRDLGAVLGHTRASTTLRYTARQKQEAKARMGRIADKLGLKNPHLRIASNE
jgi:integrase